MPPRASESKIVIPKWMWGLAVPVVGWAGHQSIELATIRGEQAQIAKRLERLEDKLWQLNGKDTTAHTAAFSAPSPAACCKPSPFPAGQLPVAAESIDATCMRRCEDR